MNGLPDPQAVAALIRAAAETEILPRYKRLAKTDIREKEPGQLVTEADEAAERLLARTLAELWPGAVVGEESVAADPSILTVLERPGTVWIVDPVDGTANFVKGDPRFAVIVALVVDGITRMGWIHDPLPNRTVYAVAGRGAWLGSGRLAVPTNLPLSAMRGSVKRKRLLAERVAGVARQGSAAHDYLDLALGRLNFAHFRKLMPWDHAAGVLIHAEAGGYSALTGGTAYRPLALPAESLLLAPTPESWRELLALID